MGYGLREVAREIKVNPGYYAHVEAGRKIPGYRVMKRIAKALDDPMLIAMAEEAIVMRWRLT